MQMEEQARQEQEIQEVQESAQAATPRGEDAPVQGFDNAVAPLNVPLGAERLELMEEMLFLADLISTERANLDAMFPLSLADKRQVDIILAEVENIAAGRYRPTNAELKRIVDNLRTVAEKMRLL